MGENTRETPHGDDRDALDIKTAAEFKKKYRGKRFTSKTAPKATLYAFLYDCYQQNEDGVKEPLYPDLAKIQEIVDTYEDMDAWNGYLSLLEWQRCSFSTAIFMRNSLQSNISDLNNIVRSILVAESLRKEAREKCSEDFNKDLSYITLEAYTPHGRGIVVETVRANIMSGLRYMNAYNSFMDIIAAETKTPEYVYLKVSLSDVRRSLAWVNESMQSLRECVAEERKDDTASAGDPDQLSPELLQTVMQNFEPIEENPPPIPERLRKEAKAYIRQNFGKPIMSWYSAFVDYSTEYWRSGKV